MTYENTEKALGEALEHDGFPAAFASSPTIARIIATDPAIAAAMRADGIIKDDEYVATRCPITYCSTHELFDLHPEDIQVAEGHNFVTVASYVKRSDITPPPPTFKPGDRVRHFDGWIGWVVPWPRDRKYFPRQQPVAVVPEGDRSVLCVDNADLTHLTGEEGS